MDSQNHKDECQTVDTNLTRSQLLIWTGQRLNPEAPLYNMAMAFDLSGNIDVAYFNEAFQTLVNGNDALRTVVYTEDGIPRQKVLDHLNVKSDYIDWSNKFKKEEELKAWSKQRSMHNFDLSKPMFDSVLHKLSEERFVWYFNQHHLITDGWSVTLLYKKMAYLYAKSLKGELTNLPPSPNYSDYRDHEKRLREASSRAQVQTHWEQKIDGLPAPSKLYGLETTAGSNSERNHVDLGLERSEKLRALTLEQDLRAWTQDLALFNLFATVLMAYLHRVSGQENLAIGTPAHNRIKPIYKETSGLFIELFPINIEVKKGESFATLFQKVQNEAFDFLKYAQPGAASPELSRSFNVVLNYINTRFSDFNGIPMKSDWVHPDHADPTHVLRLQVHDFDNSGSIQLHFDLNTTLFNEALRKEIPGHFLKLLDAFIADRSVSIGQPALLNSSEGISGPTSTNLLQATNVVQLFEQQVNVSASSPALDLAGELISYNSLNLEANKLAHHLQKMGVKKGERVAIYLKRSTELITAILAVLKTGATYIPIDTNYSGTRSERILEDANALVLITVSSLSSLPQVKASLPILQLDHIKDALSQEVETNLAIDITPQDLAYIMYTSGSTGVPKGVMISHENLAHYISWAKKKYQADENLVAPLFTATGFDLTVTTLFLPLISGGKTVIYPEPEDGPDLSLFKVLEENKVNFIKLTPSHLGLIKGKAFPESKIKTMIVGGEDFKAQLARSIQNNLGGHPAIFNEYGPTEATVGCVVQQFESEYESGVSVPIGTPIADTNVYILDDFLNAVPAGVIGELYISGKGLAKGYWKQQTLTYSAFISNPFQTGILMYKTGDLVRLNAEGILEYEGRIDEQVKISGRRIELGEIEFALNKLEGIEDCTVQLRSKVKLIPENEVVNCSKCGLPSNYPQVDFDKEHICDLCLSFEDYQSRVQKYFKNNADLQALFDKTKDLENKTYDCIALLSGGKDSTYALARLVEMGLNVLAFTLDNGYISEQAKDNIRRVVTDLGVDHMFGTTPAMNKIFVDSLLTHCNVCDGCFKTIYTLSMKVALEKNIPYIVTGLSRGQFFETRLTEELFRDENADLGKIDEIILEARKSYHRVDDAVKRLLDVSAFDDDVVFEKVKFIDFYRYTDVSLDEMLTFLDEKISWVRPTDTGRSTNCLINQAGIAVHKKERGYSNYAFPYSWDVRLGHKTRDASLEEINEKIDEQEVTKILNEIGYTAAHEQIEKPQYLVAYYTGVAGIDESSIRTHLENLLPEYMIPVQFIHLDKIPLTENGKIDRQALPLPDTIRPITSIGYVAPRTDIEEILASIWSEVLNIDKIGIHDKFLELGGSSLAAIRVISRANEAFELELPLNLAFSKPTISAFAEYVRETIMKLLEELD
jgi:amino acid adenylation domain-containing protein